jgi:hypothetical protein
MKEHHINFVLNTTTYLISQHPPSFIWFQMISFDILILQRTFKICPDDEKIKNPPINMMLFHN